MPNLDYGEYQGPDITKVANAWAAHKDHGKYIEIWAACILWDKECDCYFILEVQGIQGQPLVADIEQFQHYSKHGPATKKRAADLLDQGFTTIKDWQQFHYGIIQAYAKTHPYFLHMIAPEETLSMDLDIEVVKHKAMHCTKPKLPGGEQRDAIWGIFWLRGTEYPNQHYIIRVWGRRGNKLSVTQDEYPHKMDAQSAYEKLLHEKTKEGYIEVWWRDAQFRIAEALLPLHPIFATYLTQQEAAKMGNPVSGVLGVLEQKHKAGLPDGSMKFDAKGKPKGKAPIVPVAPLAPNSHDIKIYVLKDDVGEYKAGTVMAQHPASGLWYAYDEGLQGEPTQISAVDQFINMTEKFWACLGSAKIGMDMKAKGMLSQDGKPASSKQVEQMHKEEDNRNAQRIPLGHGQKLQEGDIITKVDGSILGKVIALLPWRSDCNVGILNDSRESRCMAHSSGKVYIAGLEMQFSLLREKKWIPGGFNALELD